MSCDFLIGKSVHESQMSSYFQGNTSSDKLLTITNIPNNFNDSLQEFDNDARINTTNKWDNNSNIYIYTTNKWIIMAPSSSERKNKGKAPIQDYS